MSGPETVRRLNFGCGFDKRAGYLNVDSDPACSPDVLLVDNDLSVLPREGFDEILALDVLEHIPRVQTIGVLLDWAELLVEGGSLCLKTSSIEGVARQISKEPSFRQQYGWTLCLFGTQAHPGDFHLTGFSTTTLRVYLLAAGFDLNRMWLTDKWLLNAEAIKASTWSNRADEFDELSDRDYVERIYQLVLRREADEPGRDFLVEELVAGRIDRRRALRHLLASAEYLFCVADDHGYGLDPPRQLFARALARTPAVLRPGVRRVGGSVRTGITKARRAVGSINAARAKL